MDEDFFARSSFMVSGKRLLTVDSGRYLATFIALKYNSHPSLWGSLGAIPMKSDFRNQLDRLFRSQFCHRHFEHPTPSKEWNISCSWDDSGWYGTESEHYFEWKDFPGDCVLLRSRKPHKIDGLELTRRPRKTEPSEYYQYTCWPEMPYGPLDIIDKANFSGMWYPTPAEAFEAMRMLMTNQLQRIEKRNTDNGPQEDQSIGSLHHRDSSSDTHWL